MKRRYEGLENPQDDGRAAPDDTEVPEREPFRIDVRAPKEPPSENAQLLGARRNRARFIRERNEAIAVITALYPRREQSHVMPPGGTMATLTERVAVCIHTPVGNITWPISRDEAADHFKYLGPILPKTHYVRLSAKERSAKLIELREYLRRERLGKPGKAKPARGKKQPATIAAVAKLAAKRKK